MITNSSSTATVRGLMDYAGGLVGIILTGTVADSQASGNVTGRDAVGGLAGSV